MVEPNADQRKGSYASDATPETGPTKFSPHTPLSKDDDVVVVDHIGLNNQPLQLQHQQLRSPCAPEADGLCARSEPAHIRLPHHEQNVIDYLGSTWRVWGVRELVRNASIAVVHHVANQVAEWEANSDPYWRMVGNPGGFIRKLILAKADDWHGKT